MVRPLHLPFGVINMFGMIPIFYPASYGGSGSVPEITYLGTEDFAILSTQNGRLLIVT